MDWEDLEKYLAEASEKEQAFKQRFAAEAISLRHFKDELSKKLTDWCETSPYIDPEIEFSTRKGWLGTFVRYVSSYPLPHLPPEGRIYKRPKRIK
ncbi:MAG: hypothetical protein ACREYF_17575 [Gammaproteobacteria bacterium]